MKKLMFLTRMFIVLFAVALVGCASHKPVDTRPMVSEVGFDLPNGSLTLIVDKDGNLVSAKTTASAQVMADTPAGHEAAVIVAQSRAKRTLAEFMTDQIRSSNSINQIANATNESNTYAQEVVEKINTNAQALLRGAYLSKQSLVDRTVMVEVTVTPQSIYQARNLRAMMSGM